MPKIWQAAEARHWFTELVNAAVHGEPQFVERRDGTAVVVVSREYSKRPVPR
jgi:prevent-host-death family protein